MRTKTQKQEEVKLLRKKLSDASSVIAVDYRGLTVADSNALRANLREAGGGKIEYRVAKNTLLEIALEGTDNGGLASLLTGPTALAFSFDEPFTMVKALVDYTKENEKFQIKGGIVDGEPVDLAQIGALAALPSRDELRGMLAGTLQAPMRNLAGTLQALLGCLRNALEARCCQLGET